MLAIQKHTAQKYSIFFKFLFFILILFLRKNSEKQTFIHVLNAIFNTRARQQCWLYRLVQMELLIVYIITFLPTLSAITYIIFSSNIYLSNFFQVTQYLQTSVQQRTAEDYNKCTSMKTSQNQLKRFTSLTERRGRLQRRVRNSRGDQRRGRRRRKKNILGCWLRGLGIIELVSCGFKMICFKMI